SCRCQQKPNAGNDKIDNIKNAREYQTLVAAEITKLTKHFVPVTPIPDRAEISEQDISTTLHRTISQLQRDAASGSVTLPQEPGGGYSFSFFAPLRLLKFEEGSPRRLAMQLGEVKTICDALFAARVNSLDSLRRERISGDDLKGPSS